MSARIVGLILRVYPPGFRRRHGDEFRSDTLAQRKRAGKGVWAGLVFWVRTLPDLLGSAVRLRLSRRDGLNDPGTLHPRAALPGGIELMHSLAQDLKFATRSLLATPLVSLAIVITLALGIGTNSAIFSVVDSVLLKPFDYTNPDELVYFHARGPAGGLDRMAFSGGMLNRLRETVDSFTDIAAVTTIQQNLTGVSAPEQVQVGWASPNLFAMLGAEPALGRSFERDEVEGRAMLSHRTWQTTLAGDPDVVGRVIQLDGVPYTVVGVVGADFALHVGTRPLEIDVWKVPDTAWANGDIWNSFGTTFGLLTLVGRLDPEITLASAQREVDAFAASIRADHSEYDAMGWEIWLRPLRETVVVEVRPTLLMLLGAVGFVLLIACANVANLLLIRAGRREREISLRMALGAGRGRVIRLMLVESALLATVGGGAALLLAQIGTRMVASMAAAEIPRLGAVGVDSRVLAFTVVLALLCSVVFGLVPALRASRGDLSGAFRDARASTGRGRHRLSRGLAVTQIALSLVLLIGAGLLLASLSRLQQVQLGIRSQDLLTFSISLPGTRYEWPEGTGRFFNDFEERIAALPGARTAGVMWPLPLSASGWSGEFDGGIVEPESNTHARYVLATPDVFETIAIPLVDGRLYANDDSEFVVVVSSNLAERTWPGESAIGRTLRADPWGRGPTEFEVVGIAADVRYASLREPADETIYFDARNWSWVDWEVDVVVRADVTPASLVDPIREELAVLDAEIPIAEVRLMSAYIDDGMADGRFALRLIGLFAAVAVLLALVGLYGVLSSAVAERTREIGIRMALGSSRRQVLHMVVGSGLRLTVLGLALGVAGAIGLTRFLATFLYEVTATDVTTFAAVSAAMLLVGALASYLPARRATRLDPMAVLRTD